VDGYGTVLGGNGADPKPNPGPDPQLETAGQEVGFSPPERRRFPAKSGERIRLSADGFNSGEPLNEAEPDSPVFPHDKPGPLPPSDMLSSSYASRWSRLARSVGLAPDEPVLVALSGGADSVLLLHLVAVARPRPGVRVVHIDHGLRGAESRADADFCARLCLSLGVPLVRREIALEPEGPSLEARARDARYAVLAEEASAAGLRTVLTGHHADDALETLMMRWVRGTHLGGLAGLKAVRPLQAPDPTAPPLQVVRPLIGMRREEVRRILADHGLPWREDRSNASPRFTRNRVRHALLPGLETVCGPGAIENLRAFGAAVEAFEDRLAAGTAHLAWERPAHAVARHHRNEATLGGTLSRKQLMQLVPPLRRRALWHLLYEGTGRPPSRRLLELITRDLGAGRCARHSLPRRWSLQLRSDRLHLLPPAQRLSTCTITPSLPAEEGRSRQLELPFDKESAAEPLERAGSPKRTSKSERSGTPVRPPQRSPVHTERPPALLLTVPGVAFLPDGRQVTAEWLETAPGRPVPRSPSTVELDGETLDERTLAVRFPHAGDRFHPLGAPGGRKLTRFLADAGVPREDRTRIPVVCVGDELLWVCGLRPSETRRVHPRTTRRLRLELHEAAEPGAETLATAPEAGLFEGAREAG